MAKSKKRVFNKEAAATAKAIKGETRSQVAMAGITARSAVHVDKKKKSRSSTRNDKHKARYF